MDKFFAVILSILFNYKTAQGASINTENCYAYNTDPYLFFDRKTSYFEVDNDDISPILPSGIIKLSCLSINKVSNAMKPY